MSALKNTIVQEEYIAGDRSADQWSNLHRDAYAKLIVRDITRTSGHQQNISVSGPWGSGKSSFLDRIGSLIKQNHNRQFNVIHWKIKHYDNSERIWSHLLKSIYTEYEKDKGLLGRFRYAYEKYVQDVKKNRNLLIIKGLILLSVVIVSALITQLQLKIGFATSTFNILLESIGILSAVVLFKNELAEIIMPVISSPDSYVDTLTQHFSFPQFKPLEYPKSKIEKDMNLLLNLWLRKNEKLLILVDDLDRMTFKDIANFFDAINLFIDNENMRFIIAMESETVACATSEKIDYNGTSKYDWFEKYEVGMKHIDKYVLMSYRMDTNLKYWESFVKDDPARDIRVSECALKQIQKNMMDELGTIFYSNPRLIYKLYNTLEVISDLHCLESSLNSKLGMIDFEKIKAWLIFTHQHPISSSYMVYVNHDVKSVMEQDDIEEIHMSMGKLCPSTQDLKPIIGYTEEEVRLCERYIALFFERAAYISRIKEVIVKKKLK